MEGAEDTGVDPKAAQPMSRLLSRPPFPCLWSKGGPQQVLRKLKTIASIAELILRLPYLVGCLANMIRSNSHGKPTERYCSRFTDEKTECAPSVQASSDVRISTWVCQAPKFTPLAEPSEEPPSSDEMTGGPPTCLGV